MAGRGLPCIAVTAGDVAGIGPEVVVRACGRLTDHADTDLSSSPEAASVAAVCLPLLIGHPDILLQAAQLYGVDLSLRNMTERPQNRESLQQLLWDARADGRVLCWNPAANDVLAANRCIVSAEAGDAAFQYLAEAIRLARRGLVDGIATAPLNKESLHLAGHHYPGHTEILAEHCGVQNFAMMLYLPEVGIAPLRRLVRSVPDARTSTPSEPSCLPQHGLSIAHVTLHTSIRSVPEMLTVDGIAEKARLMHGFLAEIGCQRRAIAVCALNPHGGENGLFGDEEARVIAPAVSKAKAAGFNVTGPLPVDTLIRRAVSGEFDGVVAMYHDQGHIPVKLIGFDSAVNITLGLPIVRTSPTHGTAFDRAWNRDTPADAAGMTEAIRTAALLSSSESRVSEVLPG